MMRITLRNLSALFIPACLILSAFCQESGLSPLVETEAVTLYAYPDLDLHTLLDNLHYTYFLRTETLFDSQSGAGDILARTLEGIYLEVLDLLDIHDYRDHISIKVFPSAEELKTAMQNYPAAAAHPAAFYLAQSNTIYISRDNLNLSTLTDELSQAIIATYFSVPPPSTVRQALCGYVQYHVKQLTDKALP